MIVVVSGADGEEPALTLEDADECGRFHLDARGVDRDGVALALARAGAGRLAGDDAYIEPAVLRRMAEGDVGPDWDDRFAGMLDYAARKGWLDKNGAVQAHIEWA